ncbi:hypothetical protein GLOIN_2v1550993 [Rhizophagus irregularis DAOM 181602=DAOM 197198]|uniref:Uncharacterized protein n=1 Tax=Rhizophagus irregularis (strain DAOM 181602 / DAOM 197198 / MUCL 43194) TaxID=747089 RepID=A0A2P4QHI0_RHIID|nr:hypothetical protein GLOIN_2v1550993 [Rhizophagus irregularis DAOM 181602=DAOM 197198]POG77084.1 hypothetical protein GLOIN_2v1550993 [Rhizophagus irregularis DAOM 181602=DAOM 197198]|eukprot:XP_025183950.1 hypothetical protein GLOIN_2v1550993 [Rhizophagus irregularis DAOM 181602=DAOM 197198]
MNCLSGLMKLLLKSILNITNINISKIFKKLIELQREVTFHNNIISFYEVYYFRSR